LKSNNTTHCGGVVGGHWLFSMKMRNNILRKISHVMCELAFPAATALMSDPRDDLIRLFF
jgi:hypothetical protein